MVVVDHPRRAIENDWRTVNPNRFFFLFFISLHFYSERNNFENNEIFLDWYEGGCRMSLLLPLNE